MDLGEEERSAAAATKVRKGGAEAPQVMQQPKPKSPADPLIEARNADAVSRRIGPAQSASGGGDAGASGPGCAEAAGVGR